MITAAPSYVRIPVQLYWLTNESADKNCLNHPSYGTGHCNVRSYLEPAGEENALKVSCNAEFDKPKYESICNLGNEDGLGETFDLERLQFYNMMPGTTNDNH